MRSLLCAVMLALCLVAWDCTAADGPPVQVDEGEKGVNAAGATTTTVAPNQGSLDKPVNQPQGDSERVPEPEPAPVVKAQPEVVATTTTTTANKQQLDKVPEIRTDEVPPNAQQGQSSSEGSTGPGKSGVQVQKTGGSQRTDKADVKATTTTTGVEPGAQQEGSSPAEGKTTTTTAQVSTISGSQEDKVQDQSTQSKEGATPDLTVQDAAAAATTTTTNAPTITLPNQSKIPQSVNNKDSSSSAFLVVAFAMLAALAVIPVAPVY